MINENDPHDLARCLGASISVYAEYVLCMFLNNYSNRHDLLIDWLLEYLPGRAAVLDIGANDGGFCPEVRRIAKRSSVFAGVDPDTAKLDRHQFLTHRYYGTLENALIPSESFDIAYAIYVLEHVENAVKFIEAVHRVLRPGGSFFFITPNGNHYFAAIAGLLARMNLQGRTLRVIRHAALVDAYHYPALYRLNTPWRLRKLGGKAGFSKFEFQFSERFDEIACYFPGPLKVFPWLWERGVGAAGAEGLLLNLMGRMQK